MNDPSNYIERERRREGGREKREEESQISVLKLSSSF
jgi:hypothetical protein